MTAGWKTAVVFVHLIKKTMKENELIKMRNQLRNLTGLVNAALGQMQNLKDLSIGTLETLKRMPGYQEALDQLKADTQEDSGTKNTEEAELVK